MRNVFYIVYSSYIAYEAYITYISILTGISDITYIAYIIYTDTPLHTYICVKIYTVIIYTKGCIPFGYTAHI